MSDLTIEIDFTGVSAATGGIAILEPGLQTAVIEEFVHYTDSGNVLYVYLNTDGLRHRERYNLANDNALPFLMALLVSAGVPEAKLAGKAKIPFGKMTGRTVYFNYTPPNVDAAGKRMDGSYPKYTFYPKARYERMVAITSASSDDIVVETPAPTKSKGNSKPAASGDEFDFLLS